MKNKSDLKRKVLCSLLAASTMGIFYSSDALAASVNGNQVDTNGDGIITEAELVGAGSHHFIIGQGESITVGTNGDVNQLLHDIAVALPNKDINAIRVALAEHANVGVVGGEAQLDTGLKDLFNNIANGEITTNKQLYDFVKDKLGMDLSSLPSIAEKVVKIDTAKENEVTKNGDTNLTIGGEIVKGEKVELSQPVVIGAVGGDLSVNAGINGSLDAMIKKGGSILEGGSVIGEILGLEEDIQQKVDLKSQETSITRNGNVNLNIASGNVLGGVGASAAITVGNIDIKANNEGLLGIVGVTLDADILLDGKTTTTLNGDVNTIVNADANVGAFANGGGAIAIGGEATSTVNGNSYLYINGYEVNEDGSHGNGISMTKGVNGVAAGVSGGGVAVTTIGGKATSTVNGNTNIVVTDAIAGAVIGGGVAASVDATGVAEGIYKEINKEEIEAGTKDEIQYGNNNGKVTIDGQNIFGDRIGSLVKDNIDITINEAVQGGTAEAITKDTNITLQGTSAGVGVIGGGLAAASHTYTWRDKDNTNLEEADKYQVNDEYGKSVANADTDKATINVALDSSNFDRETFMDAIGGMKDAVKSIAGGSEFAGLDAAKEALKNAANQGAAAGIFGGGMAVSQSGNRNNLNNNGLNDQGAFATADTAGADINLYSGYVAGVFGGGVAAAINNSHATANMTDTVNINVYDTMNEKDKNTVIGIFGNGLAYYTGEYMSTENDGSEHRAYLEGTATVTAKDTNINVDGLVDGIVNGGLAIDDSEAETTNAIVTTENGTINIGSTAVVNTINFDGFNDLVGNVPTDEIDMASYVAGVKEAAEGVAIAAGGVAVGGGAESTVKNAEVNVFGTVNGDIIGGGVAAYGFAETDENGAQGAHVDTSTLNLYAGAEINGNVYAGGSASINDAANKGYTKAQATVGEATINLAGADVNGFLSGKGVHGDDDNYKDNEKVGSSTLNLIGENTLTFVKDKENTPKVKDFTNFNATAGSVTTVEGLNNNTALIDATGTKVTVDGSAKLDITALAANGTEYKVISTDGNTAAEDKADDTFWTDSSLLYDRTAGYAHGEGQAEGNYNVVYEEITDANVDEATDGFVDAIGDNGEEIRNNIEGLLKDPRNTFSGFDKFMEDASTSGNYADVGKMAMIGEAAGVTSNTIDVAGDMADNSVLRLSFTQDNITGEPKVNEDGAIWAKYIHNKHDLDGMASSFGSVDSSSDFDGATIGVDFAKKGKVQSGIAFSYGSGDSHGMGINNDFDMWGVSLYGNVKNDDTNVIADIGFSESDNELTGNAMGKDIKADRDVSVFTVGVRAEKLYTNGSTQIVPYTGLRYYNVDPDSYTAYYDGQKFGEYDADRQNIWTLPVGVSLRNETVTESGWRLTPKVDVAYIWAFGDTDNSFDLNTGSGVDTLDYTVMDSGSWLGSVGFEAGKDDWAFGVGYSYQKGSHEEANKWFVNVEYSF